MYRMSFRLQSRSALRGQDKPVLCLCQVGEVFRRGEVMKKTKNVWKKFALQNPKNLEREVHIYGYHYSWRTHSISILGTLVGSSAAGFCFSASDFLHDRHSAAATFVLPLLVLDMYKRMYEQKRFADVAAYMEQMLYSFQKTGKVTGALKETREIFWTVRCVSVWMRRSYIWSLEFQRRHRECWRRGFC